jgi:hypothetical protein
VYHNDTVGLEAESSETEVRAVTYKTLVQLIEVLEGLERDLGLQAALPVERHVAAVIDSFHEHGVEQVRTETIANHPLLANVPRATLHRSIRSLVNRGVIRPVKGRKIGLYMMDPNFLASEQS